MKPTEDLYIFYKEWLAWATDPEATSDVFSAFKGLCSNVQYFEEVYNLEDVYTELKYELVRITGESVIPFQDGCEYHTESFNGLCHLNEMRLSFVRSRIEAYESTLHQE